MRAAGSLRYSGRMHLRAAWLFTRGLQSVRIELREEPDRFVLWEHGPEQKSEHRVFADHGEALTFQHTREQELRRDGFRLDVHEEWSELGRRVPVSDRRHTEEGIFPEWERRTGADRRGPAEPDAG